MTIDLSETHKPLTVVFQIKNGEPMPEAIQNVFEMLRNCDMTNADAPLMVTGVGWEDLMSADEYKQTLRVVKDLMRDRDCWDEGMCEDIAIALGMA